MADQAMDIRIRKLKKLRDTNHSLKKWEVFGRLRYCHDTYTFNDLGLMVSVMMPSSTLAQTPHKERPPAIRAAINALEKAKVDLEHAAHDFGGHRAEALKGVDNAVNQPHQALEYDKK